MKNYLSLIPISARVHRRQNRMTLLCIIFSVFLVTTIFSMADMVIREEKNRLINRHGDWYIKLEHISDSEAEEIGRRPEVSVVSWYDVLNADTEQNYKIGEEKAILCGTDEAYIAKIWNGWEEGTYPQKEGEVMLSPNAKKDLGVETGDCITVKTPGGSMDYTITGFGGDDVDYNEQYDAVSVFMTRTAFGKLFDMNSKSDAAPVYYVQFKKHTNISKILKELKKQYGWTEKNISENTAVLGVTGFSSNSTMLNIYLIAAVLFVLILIAGVLMISGSMNSNVAQRTKFFGMLRCIGASRQQIIRFVRLEALNWCKIAIPAGIMAGLISTWGICAILRFGIGGEFSFMPLFGLSGVGIISGIAVGVLSVLFAAQSPAKCAAKVSPVAAVSGNTENTGTIYHGANIYFAKIETALGIKHAVSAKKNLILMTGSFALSIILILGFSVLLNTAQALLPSLRQWQPDVSIISRDSTCSLDRGIVDQIDGMTGVEHVFGNMCVTDVPIVSDKKVDKVILASYDEYMLQCAKTDLVEGNLSKLNGDSNYVLTIYNKDNPIRVNDKIKINGTEVEIAGALSDGLFGGDIVLICSEETFTRLTGEQNYAMINVKLTDTVTDRDIKVISKLAGEDALFSDIRESNQQTNGTYWATRVLGYGFLAIIGLIAVFNMINSTSMSVSARIKQYGAMRAVGMDGHQLTKMIGAEVFTYILSGYVAGCALGLPLHYFLFKKLITEHFGNAWGIPIESLTILFLLILVSAVTAILILAKRIKNMAVTDTINEL